MKPLFNAPHLKAVVTYKVIENFQCGLDYKKES